MFPRREIGRRGLTLFDRVRQVENMGLIEVERGDSSRMESFMLTGEGIAVLKK
jgi:hypothetical protein